VGEWGPGETGPRFQNPVTRTHRPTETRVPREACHRLRAGVLTGGPALQVPLLGRHSIQPQGGGCEHRKSTGAQGAPHLWGCWGPSRHPSSRTPALHMGLLEDGSQARWEGLSLHNRMAPSVAEAPRALAQYSAARSGNRTLAAQERAAKVSLPVRATPSQRPGMVACNWPVTAAPLVVGGSCGSEFLRSSAGHSGK